MVWEWIHHEYVPCRFSVLGKTKNAINMALSLVEKPGFESERSRPRLYFDDTI